MSEADRRLRVIALGFATVAVVIAIVAVVIVVRRGDTASEPSAKGSAHAPAGQVRDHTVAASEVVKLQRNSTSVVVENGTVKGIKITDEALAKTLGLEPGDVVSAISGRPLMSDGDVSSAMFNVSMMSATTLYAEITRNGAPLLLRWRLDGDLKQARYSNSGGTLASLYSPTPPAPDPLLDTIEKVDETHAKLPRATADKLFADPTKYTSGARAVPAIKNGQPAGIKLYAIRPSSVYARLGLHNGDTIEAINGDDVTTMDKVLEMYTKLKAANDVTLDVTRRGKAVQLTITITK